MQYTFEYIVFHKKFHVTGKRITDILHSMLVCKIIYLQTFAIYFICVRKENYNFNILLHFYYINCYVCNLHLNIKIYHKSALAY